MTKARSSTFYWGMRLLAEPKRSAMYALYDLARAIDDTADGDGTIPEKRAALAAWRDEIDALYRGQPTRAETQAIAPYVWRFDLPRAEFDALIDGQEMDLEAAAYDEARLVLYCRRVAGTIGLLTLAILGVRAEDYAITLGEAFQRINILRDRDEDRARGRDYVPPGTDLMASARAQLDAAERLRAGLDARALRPALVMTELYAALLDAIERGERRLGRFGKLRAVLRGLWKSR
jgi:phytoene/squalene synthetase